MAAPEKVVIGNAELWLGDCREILPTLPKHDAVVTDPPYGIGYFHSGSSRSSGAVKTWVNDIHAGKEWALVGDDRAFDPAHLLALEVPLILWGANHYSDKLPASSKWLIWNKRTDIALGLWSFADLEMAWCSQKGPARLFNHTWMGALRAGEENQGKYQREHPTQKPLQVMKWCVEQLPKAKSIIDPYMGSGTTGVACAQLGRKFTGIEIEPRYFEIACRRIEQAQVQGRLFEDFPVQPKQEVMDLPC